MIKHTLTVPERHQLKIARQTLQMPDAMANVMGGMTKKEAGKINRKLKDKMLVKAVYG